MNSVEDISKKILECSQNERLEILISLRAFLLECQDSPWIIFKDQESYTKDLTSAQNNNIEHFKLKNERNIKRINIHPIELILLPRNKKNSLLSLLDDSSYNLFADTFVIYDLCRMNPFSNDNLYNFITTNQIFFDKKIIQLYQSRHENIKHIKEFANISNQIYESSLCTSRKNKIKDYWIHIWGIKDKYIYQYQSTIENLIL